MLGGETHYTTRPGLPELRRRLLGEIAQMGGPCHESVDSALITTGESEALFVALLGLRPQPGSAAGAYVGPCRYENIFRIAGLVPKHLREPATEGRDTRLVFREFESDPAAHEILITLSLRHDLPDVLFMGDKFAPGSSVGFPPCSIERTLILGNFDALPGLSAFRIGFLAGPDALVRRIRVWKQALSICSAASSQRAAVHALRTLVGGGEEA